jgi:hypothetical protein
MKKLRRAEGFPDPGTLAMTPKSRNSLYFP